MVKSVYIASILATLAIVLALYFGVLYAEKSNASSLNDEINKIALENALYTSFADFNGSKDVYCSALTQSIQSLSERSDVLEKRLSKYQSDSFNSSEFVDSKKSYLIVNMILFKNFEDAKNYCDLNTKVVLFFYAEDKSCGVDCEVVGLQLDNLKKSCSSFREFNFPYNWPYYPFTKILEVKYGVTSVPSVVIDGSQFDLNRGLEALSHELNCA